MFRGKETSVSFFLRGGFYCSRGLFTEEPPHDTGLNPIIRDEVLQEGACVYVRARGFFPLKSIRILFFFR